MSRPVLHVWDVGHVETSYACGADPGQPAACLILSSLHRPDLRRLSGTKVCGNCKRIVRARLLRLRRPGRREGKA